MRTGFPVMKTGFSLWEKSTQGKPCTGPVWDCSAGEYLGTFGLQCTAIPVQGRRGGVKGINRLFWKQVSCNLNRIHLMRAGFASENVSTGTGFAVWDQSQSTIWDLSTFMQISLVEAIFFSLFSLLHLWAYSSQLIGSLDMPLLNGFAPSSGLFGRSESFWKWKKDSS